MKYYRVDAHNDYFLTQTFFVCTNLNELDFDITIHAAVAEHFSSYAPDYLYLLDYDNEEAYNKAVWEFIDNSERTLKLEYYEINKEDYPEVKKWEVI